MVDEEEKKQPTEAPKKTVLEETKDAISELKREREEIAKVKEELQQLRSDQLLAGTSGIRQEPEAPKEETAIEYKNRIMSNKDGGHGEV